MRDYNMFINFVSNLQSDKQPFMEGLNEIFTQVN
jgi:hypothetical protein